MTDWVTNETDCAMVADAASTSGSTITTNAGTNTGTPASQRNTGQNNRHQQGRGNNRGISAQTGTNQGISRNVTTGRNFKGDTDAMNGNVFQLYEEQNDPMQFTKTMEALHGYAKKELKTTDLAPLFATPPTLPTIQKPKPFPTRPTNWSNSFSGKRSNST